MKLHLTHFLTAVLLTGTLAACDSPGPRPRTVGVVYVSDSYDPFWYWFDHHYYYYWHPQLHRVYWSFAFNDYWSSLNRHDRHLARERFRKWLHTNRPGLRPRLSDDAFVEREMKTHVLRRAEAAWERKPLKEKEAQRNRLDQARLEGRLPGRVVPIAPVQKQPHQPTIRPSKEPKQTRPLEQQRARPEVRITEQQRRLEVERLKQQRQPVIPTPRAERQIRQVEPPAQPQARRPQSIPFEERWRLKR